MVEHDDNVIPEEIRAVLWDLPLIHFAAMIGVKLTPATSILLNSWIEKHNRRLVGLFEDQADKEAIARRCKLSQN